MADQIAFTEDRDQILPLWSHVFGDSKEDIDFFLDNCKHKSCLGYFSDGVLVSMLFLVECSYCNQNGAYLYAVCTDKAYRGRGCVSRLIEKAKNTDHVFLWLIPANDSLFDFYARFGFQKKLYSDRKYAEHIVFSQKKDILAYLYEVSEYEFPVGMIYSRRNFPNGGTGLFELK